MSFITPFSYMYIAHFDGIHCCFASSLFCIPPCLPTPPSACCCEQPSFIIAVYKTG